MNPTTLDVLISHRPGRVEYQQPALSVYRRLDIPRVLGEYLYYYTSRKILIRIGRFLLTVKLTFNEPKISKSWKT